MTICFIGNSFKYEIEAVMKLFLPLVTFDFLFEEQPPQSGDICVIERASAEGSYKLSVRVRLNENIEEASLERSGKFCDKSDEADLCRI
ncbi:MAG: hypothetical protein K2K44_09550, partial [Oscillospiraceae bacterium]|nr:hypothetical protein [Oscillospiraceae bacterium]